MKVLNSASAASPSTPADWSNATFRAEVADLRNEILNNVVVSLMFFGWASVFVTVVTPATDTSRTATLLYGLALVLGAVSAWLSWSRRWPQLARWVCALGIFGLALIHFVTFPSTMALFWIAIASLALMALLGPIAGWLSVALTTVIVLPFAAAESSNVPIFVRVLVLITPVVAAMYLTHLILRTLFRALNWMLESYELARRKEMELRDQGAQLASALKSLSQTSTALAQANDQLEALVKYAEDARRSKQNFAAMISHELRAPLNLIIGFSDIMVNAPSSYNISQLPAALRSDIHVIYRNAQHLLKLVDDILDLSQLDMNQMTLLQDRLRVNEVIESAVNDFSQLAEARRLWLKVEVEPNLPEIFGDRTRLRQVLLNLLSNAVRFTEYGGITIRARLDDGQKTAEHRPGTNDSVSMTPTPSIVISVTDTGVGIPEADLQRVFEPFMQIEGPPKHKRDGSGLGLTISKKFVELHGGRMWAESKPGIGSTFYFSLPVTPASPYVGTEDIPPTGYRSEVGALGVLEGRPVLSNLLKRHLQGITVRHVRNARELDAAQDCMEAIIVNEPSSQSPSDVSLMLSHGLKHKPVIRCHMTGLFEGGKVTNLPANVCRYLTKPFTREQLNEALDYMLEQRGLLPTYSRTHESRILVVEDEEDALRLLLRLLRTSQSSSQPEQRIIPIPARSVEQALDYLLPPDAMPIEGIFLDLRLGEAHGFDLLREMARHPHLQKTPVCIVSGQEMHSQSLMSPYLALEKQGGLTSREIVEATAALLRVMLPGVQAAAR